MDIDADGPTLTRAKVKFRNWDKSGLVIQGDKLVVDAKNFRLAASLLKTIDSKEAIAAAGMLENLASQWEAVE